LAKPACGKPVENLWKTCGISTVFSTGCDEAVENPQVAHKFFHRGCGKIIHTQSGFQGLSTVSTSSTTTTKEFNILYRRRSKKQLRTKGKI